jgi:hypothetical protein
MRNITKYIPYIFFAAITVIILMPLYQPGFVLLLDMTFTPHLDLADYIKNGALPAHFPLLAIIKAISLILPVEVIQKIILSLLLFLPSVFMYQLSRRFMDSSWAVVAGIFYTLNPWVYERFIAGHWLVLLGYGLLPLLIKFCLQALVQQKKRDYTKLGILLSVYPIISLHFAFIGIILCTAITIAYLYVYRIHISKTAIQTFAKFLITTAILALVINSFWLVTFFKPQSSFTSISQNDLAAFQATGDSSGGIFGNVLALYGFWNEDIVRSKDIFPYWEYVALLIIGLTLLGAFRGWKDKNVIAITFSILFIPALILAVGIAHPFTHGITLWFYNYVPGFKGLRETTKLASILAFAYALLVPYACQWLAKKSAPHVAVPKQVYSSILAVAVILLPLAQSVAFFTGLAHRIPPTTYPQSWYTANHILQKDQDTTSVLFLPWWDYVRFPFADNRLIHNPADRFFKAPILAGSHFENPHLTITHKTTLDLYIDAIVKGQLSIDDTLPFLRSQGISHIILADEADRALYEPFLHSTKLKRALVTSDLVLFKLP